MNPNPKNVNDLDPKLKETYERVMGTSFTPNTQTQTQQAPPPPQPNGQSPLGGAPAGPQPILTPVEQPNTDTINTSQIFKKDSPFTQDPKSANTVTPINESADAEKNKKRIIPVVIGVSAVVFFVAYGVIWAKFFGLF